MVIEAFPPVSDADESGLLAVGGDLDPESLLLAYRSGIFPWPLHERQLAWFSPSERGVLFLKDFHISTSLKKVRNRPGWSFSFDERFAEVITACAESAHRPGQSGTWITKKIISGYEEFHRAGFAHSVETYYEGELVGGLYGVAIGGFFAGESMFFKKADASKLALCHLVEHLVKVGVTWIDCQMVTPLLRSFGAQEISRDDYLKILQAATGSSAIIFSRKGD
ncbi:MAG: leucyltransferase [Pseudomonadota bacterium]|jgi:leucyl/phenylalanyl-tRNA--protein transferase